MDDAAMLLHVIATSYTGFGFWVYLLPGTAVVVLCALALRILKCFTASLWIGLLGLAMSLRCVYDALSNYHIADNGALLAVVISPLPLTAIWIVASSLKKSSAA
jgi:hypothetical protein